MPVSARGGSMFARGEGLYGMDASDEPNQLVQVTGEGHEAGPDSEGHEAGSDTDYECTL